MNKVFVYETLLDLRTIKKVLGHEATLIPLKIKGLKEISKDLSKTETNYHTLIKSKNDIAEGAVFEVNDSDLVLLDKWENNYKRIELDLTNGDKIYTFILK
jgi:gamma-glutamylcyclotransferase (GGCT)/AIG2-like uncharacterized protein YtfP